MSRPKNSEMEDTTGLHARMIILVVSAGQTMMTLL